MILSKAMEIKIINKQGEDTQFLASDTYENFDLKPLVTTLLGDFDQPQDFVKYLYQLLESDNKWQKRVRKNAADPRESEYQSRKYNIKLLIEAIEYGIHF